MGSSYNAHEIIGIAIEVEKRGKEFYQKMAAHTQCEQVKNLLLFLSDQEAKHIERFQRLYDAIDNECINEGTDSEYDAYIHVLAKAFILTPQKVRAKTEEGFTSDADVIDFALQMEKDAVLTYTALQGAIADDAKHVLNDIIAEEQRHVVLLAEVQEQYM